MTAVYLHVRKQEAKAAVWAKKSGQQERHEHSRKVMQQGVFFSLAFIITWIFPTLFRLMQAITGSSPFWLVQLMTMFLPMQVSIYYIQLRAIVHCVPYISPNHSILSNTIQGLINAMVFLRPKYVKYRKDNPGRSLCSIMRHTVFGVSENTSFIGKRSVVVTMFKSSKSGVEKSIVSGVEKSIIDGEVVRAEEGNDRDNTNDDDGAEDEPEEERQTSIQWKDKEEEGLEEEKVEEA